MEELLELVAEVDEEDLLVEVQEAAWSGTSLRLRVEVSVVDHSQLGTWDIRCEHVLAQMLGSEGVFSLELTNDHPLLWGFKHPSASAFFFGVPVDSKACIGALYEAHETGVGTWIPFGSALNTSGPLSELLRTGNGLLARGPRPLLKLYKEALLPHGIEVSIVGEYPPKFWDGAIRRPVVGEDVRALLLSASYVVGIGWTAEKQTS